MLHQHGNEALIRQQQTFIISRIVTLIGPTTTSKLFRRADSLARHEIKYTLPDTSVETKGDSNPQRTPIHKPPAVTDSSAGRILYYNMVL